MKPKSKGNFNFCGVTFAHRLPNDFLFIRFWIFFTLLEEFSEAIF